MATKLDEPAFEGSSIGIVADFYEKSSDSSPDTPVIPKAGLTWTLKDGKGNIVNNRSREPLVSAQSVVILLKAPDLALSGNYPEFRHLIIDGTYDSLIGNDLTIRDELIFQIENSSDVPPLP